MADVNQLDARIRFGAVLHLSLKDVVLLQNHNYGEVLASYWSKYKSWKLEYLDDMTWDKYYEAGVDVLRMFAEVFRNSGLQAIQGETTIECVDYRGVSIQVRPDLICSRVNDTAYIPVDFKTGKGWTQRDVDESHQISQYAYALHSAFGQPFPIDVAVINLKIDQPSCYILWGKRDMQDIEKMYMQTGLNSL